MSAALAPGGGPILSEPRPMVPYAEALLAAMPTGVMFTDMNSRVRYLNPVLARFLRLGDDYAYCLGQPAEALLDGMIDPVGGTRLAVLEDGPSFDGMLRPAEIETADGRIIEYTRRAVRDRDRGPLGHLWTFNDVTHAANVHRELLFHAEHDGLTGLFNRHHLMNELERALIASVRTGQQVGMLVFDLDHFKQVNDSYGHRAGDVLLLRTAQAVSGQIRRNEVLSRLGGDEFAILVPDASEQTAGALAERVVQAVSGVEPKFDGRAHRQTCSVGLAMCSGRSISAEELMECADAAMYQAKKLGRNRWCLWK